MNKLAIVIPTYKIDFFENMMSSLEKQTCKNFNVYIGIDASDSDFEAIIDKYNQTLNIKYKRFENNLGGKDLVAQWERCLDIIQGEEWIMLFSDDDMVEERCVELFYNEINKNDSIYDLYHFNVKVIDEKNNVVRLPKHYPDVLYATDFLKAKCTAKIESFVVEYIFKRETFFSNGGFEHFDMAWGTDIATWAKLGRRKGIKTICGADILWRQSNKNITPDMTPEKIRRKLCADSCFLIWCNDNFKGITKSDTYYYMFRLIFHYSEYIEKKDLADTVKPLFYKTNIGKAIYSMIMKTFPLLKKVKIHMHHSS